MAALTNGNVGTLLPATCISFTFPGLPRVQCLFTTRRTGTLSLRTDQDQDTVFRRKSLLRQLKLTGWSELHQIHGDAFLPHPEASPPDKAPLHTPALHADGQCTSRARLALIVKTADCQPVLLAHKAGHIAALHVGWRGNVLQFPQTGVAAFCKACNILPEEVVAVRGPSLGWAQFVNFEREWPEKFAPWFDPLQQRVDLWGLTRHQLRQAGLSDQHIFSLDLCTYSLSKTFFSHRRGDAGRQAALIWIQD